MNYKINLGVWGSVFAVPSCVVDHYIRIADGKQLKTLLYLLKNASATLREEDIAAVTGLEPCDVSDALLFWENVGVIAASDGELFPAQGDSAERKDPAERKDTDERKDSGGTEIPAGVKAKLSADTQFPPKEIASAVNSDRAVRYLFETFERLAGRPTKHAERNTLMLLIEEAGMPCEVAVMLVEYCFSIDRATPAYIKAAALDWCESGIDTIGKAEERIQLLRSRHSLESRLHARFGMTSAFSKSQKEILAVWAEAQYPDELLDEAYDLCMKNTGKLNLKYMDSILRSWAEKGYTAAAQTKAEKKPETVGSSFCVDELEQAAYAKYKKLGGNGN